MEEGKQLLLSIINEKIDAIANMDLNLLTFEDVNLLDISSSIKASYYNFSNVSDSLINYVLSSSPASTSKAIELMKLRDLLIGHRDYNLKFKLTDTHENIISLFLNLLDNTLNERIPGVLDYDITLNEIKDLKNKLLKNEIINNFDIIKKLVHEYNPVEFDTNMLNIMNYINIHNISILDLPKKQFLAIDIKHLRKDSLDDRIKDILNKLDINIKEIPYEMFSELKNMDPTLLYETYDLVKKNKAEDYGIMHLFDNKLNILYLLMYSNPKSITTVIDLLKDAKGNLDINSLKILINTTVTCFFVLESKCFMPKYNDFVKNFELIKSLKINYQDLIQRNPLLLVMNNDMLKHTLDEFNKYHVDKKKVINKCYKIISINPQLLINNLDILSQYINIEEYLKGDNYNILKLKDLDKKINIILKEKEIDIKDGESIRQAIIQYVYTCVKENKPVWGDLVD